MKYIKYNNITEKEKDKVEIIFNLVGVGRIKKISELSGFNRRIISNILLERDVNIYRRLNYYVDDYFFSNIDSEEKAYILGYFLADGSTNKNNVEFASKDKEYLKQIANVLKFTGEIYQSISGYNKIFYYLKISSHQMSNDLQNLGMGLYKAKKVVSLPDILFYLIPHFIRGYFDGDGCIYKSESKTKSKYGKIYNYYKFGVEIIGNIKFLKSIAEEFSNINIKYNYKDSKCEYMKYIRISGYKNLYKFYNYLYKDANIYLERKYEIFKDMNNIFGKKNNK